MENAIERAIILAEEDVITPELLDLDEEDDESHVSTGLVGAETVRHPHADEGRAQ